MLKFVIISNNLNNIRKCKDIINNTLIDIEYYYKIYEFFDSNDKLSCFLKNNIRNNIYIIDQDSGVDSKNIINSIINTHEDLCSFIMIIDLSKQLDNDNIYSISEFNIKIFQDYKKYQSQLKNTINHLVKLLDKKDKCIKCYYDGCLYKIPYSDILYIEKETNSKLCKIVCKNECLYVNKTIKELKTEVDSTFIQTHRSALVNRDNIYKIDIRNGRIVFTNATECYLISRNNKKSLKLLFSKNS